MCFLALSVTTARADTIPALGPGGGTGEWRLAIGPVAGAVALDEDLTNYRWDTQPAVQSGIQATLYRGRFAAGLRYSHSNTTQGTGLPDTDALRVSLNAFDLVAQVRVVKHWGFEMWGSAFGGRLHMGYDPDEMTFDSGTALGSVTVNFDPISEWQLGTGLEMRRELMRQLALSLQGEGSTFALDTAHRSGSEIVESRERFYNWSLRLQVSWLLNFG
jgi:hypothetical protein